MSKKRKKLIKTLVDIIIPVYGRLDYLEKCLDSIPEAFSVPYSIKIVDDNSPNDIEVVDNVPTTKTIFPDAIKELLSQEKYSGLDIRFIRNTKNLGFPQTCNVGARQGFSPLILFLNTDVELTKESGDVLVKTMDDSTIGVAGMKLLFPEKLSPLQQRIRTPGKVQHVGISINIHGDAHHIFIGWSPDNPKVNQFRDVPAVTGGALMTRRSLFNKIKGFDKVYGKGTWEDVDFCFSVRELGSRVVIQPEAVAYHVVGGSSAEQGSGFPLFQNKQIFYNRWSEKVTWSDVNLL